MKVVIGIILISIFISSCSGPSTTVSVDVPAQNLSRIISPIQVSNFSSNQSKYGRRISEQVKSDLLQAGYVKISKNHGQGVLKGNIDIDRSTEHTRSYTAKSKKRGQYTMYSVQKTTVGRVSYTLLDRAGNTISSGVYNSVQSSSSSDESSSDARSKNPSDEEHRTQIIEALATKITIAISPTKRTSKISLQTGNHPGFEYGHKYLKGGLLPQAINAWKQAAQESTKKSDKAAAYYNIGVAYESQQAYKQAYEMFKKADELKPADSTIIKGLVRLRRKKTQQDSVRKQIRR